MILNYVVIALYFSFLISIAFVFKKLNKDEGDYFKAGARGSWWMVGMSLFMSSISTQTFIANSGVAFKAGFSIYWIYIVGTISYLIMALGVAAWYRQARVTTFAEIVRDRFGSSFQQFFTYYQIIITMIGGGIGLFMLALFAKTIFHFPLQPTIIALGMIVLFYTLIGGNWAVLAADFLQSLVLLSMAILMAALCFNHIGGFDGFFEAIKSQGLGGEFNMITRGRDDGLYGIEWLIGVGVIQIYAMIGMGGGQRFFSCKDGMEARKAALFCMVMSFIGMLVYFVPPMTARLLYASEVMQIDTPSPSDVSYAFMSLKLLPLGFVPLMVVAMFSAQMSTMDTALNANSALFVKNAYPAIMRLIGKQASENHKFLLMLGRLFTVVMGSCLVLVSLYFANNAGDKGIFELTFHVNSLVAIPLIIPLFIGFFIRKTPMWSGWVCFAAALLASIICNYFKVPSFRIAMINSSAGILAFLATGFFWKSSSQDSKQKILMFFERIHTPVDFEKETGKSNDAQQLRLVGILACCLGGFITLFLLLPNTVNARLCIAAVALTILSVGTLLLVTARIKSRKEEV